MKTLNTIQTLSKIGKIFSKVLFILCVIGGIFCLVGILEISFVHNGLKIGGVTIHSIIEQSGAIDKSTWYGVMATGIVLCAGEAVLCKLAEMYFKNELKAGTPFTFDGAKELMRLGIFTICIPLGTDIVVGIISSVIGRAYQLTNVLDINHSAQIGLGVMFIVTSLLCRYGAEIIQQHKGVQHENSGS